MGDKAGSCSSPRDCFKPAAAHIPAHVTELRVRNSWVPPHAALEAVDPGHSSLWERPYCGCKGPGYSTSAEISCSGCACWIQHLHGNPPAQAVRTQEMPSPRKRGCGSCAGWGCAGRAWGAHSGRELGCLGCSWLWGDGGELDAPLRLKVLQESMIWSSGHPCRWYRGRRDREIAARTPVPKILTQNLPPLPRSLCAAPSRASCLHQVLGELTPSLTPGLSQARSGKDRFLRCGGQRCWRTWNSTNPSDQGCRSP